MVKSVIRVDKIIFTSYITLMKILLSVKPDKFSFKNPLVLAMFEGEVNTSNFDLVADFLKLNPSFGKFADTQWLCIKGQNILLVGAGKKDKFDYAKLQNWAGIGVRFFLEKADEIEILVPPSELETHTITEAVSLGVEIAGHDIQVYKTEKKPVKLKSIQLLVEKNDRGFSEGLKKGLVLAEYINLARRLGDMPSNEMTPSYFLSVAKKVAKEQKLKITIIDKLKAKRLGMGGFAAIAQGSVQPSFLIALEYKGDVKSKDKWGIVGKGVTFDSGGISIKPSSGMHEMKYDMSGAGAVLAAMGVIAKLKPKVNAVGIMAVTENMPGSSAVKPGDIIKTYSGKTAEILNTDAEGRVILADAISFAQKDFKANILVDVATLTGAMIISLGDDIAGVFSNNPVLADQIIRLGKAVGEKFWQMPMDEEYDELIKSDFADFTNTGHGSSMPGAAGSITGAKFIERVIEKNHAWVHVDIAGTAWDMKPKAFRSVGATGFAVKTLVELLTSNK